jgi:hypothetical protein
MKDALSA